MPGSRVSKDRQQRFLAALAATGKEGAAAGEVGLDLAPFRELRRDDRQFAAQWDQALRSFPDRLEQEAHRRAIAGIPEPLVSDGKVVRDDDGHPILVQRPSERLLLALLQAHHPEKFYGYPAWFRWIAVVAVIAYLLWVIGDLALRLGSLHYLVR
jgi:hypothetical protein